MTYVLTLLLLFAGGNPGRDTLSGQVFSAETQQPLAHVHVSTKSGNGTVTDENGRFQLEAAENIGVIRLSRLGYISKEIEISRLNQDMPDIYLQPATSRLDEVLIEASPAQKPDQHTRSEQHASTTGDFIESLSGVSTIKRANYGWEPAIRGMSAGRMEVFIDDVKMAPACVDRMDPITSYVETGNLEKAEVSRGNSDLSRTNRPGGSLNLVTSRPGYEKGWFGDLEMGGGHNALRQKYSATSGYSNSRTALRSAVTYRQAGNYHAGGREEIPISGYDKLNVKLDADRKFTDQQTGRFTYIGDHATDIGYPGLIMDTEKARSHLFSYEHEWKSLTEAITSLRIKPYHTRVDHWMDDYQRDVTEREVMPDMYMPMYGETRTAGARTDMMMARDGHLLDLGLHTYRLDGFADMLMEPLDESESDMYLYNIGDARFYTAYLSANYEYFPGDRWSFNLNSSLELSDRDLRNATAGAVFETEYGDISLSNFWSAFSGAASVTYNAEKASAALSVSESTRLPSHIEHYGYYIYNPVDDYFYHGNPELTPERSTQTELNLIVLSDERTFGIEAALFLNYMRDYIAGKPASKDFQRYTNYDEVVMSGGEISAFWEPAEHLLVTTGGSYVFAENLELSEPLPMTPPPEGFVSVARQTESYELNLRVRGATRQERVADQTTRETPTDGYVLVDISGSYNLTEQVRLNAGVRNLFDEHYIEHTTPGDMPNPGRDLYVRMSYSW